MIRFIDHHSTTRLLPCVQDVVTEELKLFCGNCASAHTSGRSALQKLQQARGDIARHFHVDPSWVILNSGATEGANHVILGVINRARRERRVVHILTTPIEHTAVLNPLRYHRTHFPRSVKVHEVKVDVRGLVDQQDYVKILEKFPIDLVCCMLVNHEVGTVQDVKTLSRLAHRYQAVFFSDATQAVGKMAINMAQLGLDGLCCSGHKFGSLPGSGLLIVSPQLEARMDQILFGGDQEEQRRPGTQNVLAARAMATALAYSEKHWRKHKAHREKLEEYFLRRCQEVGLDLRVNGRGLALSVTFLGPVGSMRTSANLTRYLSEQKVCVSHGSACKSRSSGESYVFAALGLPSLGPSLRIGIGPDNTEEDLEALVQALVSAK